ncbi:hypothetical protein [Rhodocista pekingensis]|uniref:Flagellar hook-length control protein FliK n=1 Tax=Rhodocista pekingensis TaxID=201185 RepID=A0ABW2L030_9PROT
MIVPPSLTSAPQVLPTPATPQHTPTLASAILSAQGNARPVETQTARAAAAPARIDRSREARDATSSGHTVDSEAQAVRARTPPGRDPARGNRLDLSV